MIVLKNIFTFENFLHHSLFFGTAHTNFFFNVIATCIQLIVYNNNLYTTYCITAKNNSKKELICRQTDKQNLKIHPINLLTLQLFESIRCNAASFKQDSYCMYRVIVIKWTEDLSVPSLIVSIS